MSAHNAAALLARLLPHLTPDLLEPARRRALTPGCSPLTGHCAVATEALYHALGGRGSGYTPMSIQHEGTTHWYLRAPDGRYLDPTAEQFRTAVPYARGRGRGFPTPRQGAAVPPPSRRAATVLRRAGLTGVVAAGAASALYAELAVRDPARAALLLQTVGSIYRGHYQQKYGWSSLSTALAALDGATAAAHWEQYLPRARELCREYGWDVAAVRRAV